MNEYLLFLDESKPNNQINHFCLAGCIIEKQLYENQIIPFINQIKIDIFGSKDVILHETDIREATEAYRVMRTKETRYSFWQKMSYLFDNYDITVIGSVITPSKCKQVYNSTYLNDEYFMGLQILLENYSYFLEQNNGKGSIYIESRNLTEDLRLQNHYFNLLASGTLFLKKNSLQSYLTTINFLLKSENNIGLQIADFIPNVMKKHAYELQQRTPSIVSNIMNRLYDGKINDNKRFGMKIIM